LSGYFSQLLRCSCLTARPRRIRIRLRAAAGERLVLAKNSALKFFSGFFFRLLRLRLNQKCSQYQNTAPLSSQPRPCIRKKLRAKNTFMMPCTCEKSRAKIFSGFFIPATAFTAESEMLAVSKYSSAFCSA